MPQACDRRARCRGAYLQRSVIPARDKAAIGGAIEPASRSPVLQTQPAATTYIAVGRCDGGMRELTMKVPKCSAGLVVLRRIAEPWHCLVLRAYRNWDLPKGLPEPEEGPLPAALREASEETGLSSLELRWGEDYRETEPYGRGKVARFYLALSPSGEVSLPISAEIGRPEHHEFRWVTFAEARQLLPSRYAPILDWAERTVSTDC